MSRSTLHHGDCLAVLPTLEANSVHAIVTDPPYGLGFMGKEWDHGVPGEAFWREAIRVAKPGAHLLAFGGTRKFHRLMVGIEDAGWEIRDTIMWVYGSGFPKSLDVSKAIDAAAGAERTETTGLGWHYGTGRGEGHTTGAWAQPYQEGDAAKGTPLTAPATPEAAEWDGWGTALKPAHEMIVWATKPGDGVTIDASLLALEQELWSMCSANGVGVPSPSNPSVSDAGLFDGAQWSADGSINTPADSSEPTDTLPSALALTLCWNTVRSWRRILGALSEVMSTSTTEITSGLTTDLKTLWSSVSPLTATNMLQNVMAVRGTTPPVSPAVECFNGVADKLAAIRILSAPVSATGLERRTRLDGVELRPNWRPIIVARKPLAGTVAQNVLKHGTGGINVDACRVGIDVDDPNHRPGETVTIGPTTSMFGVGQQRRGNMGEGRWPANLIHDGSEEVLSLFPESEGGAWPASGARFGYSGGQRQQLGERTEMIDSGSAARFFYCAKASREDREEGLADMPLRSAGEATDRIDGTAGLQSPRAGASRTNGARNFHPTVKPTVLMRYLCKLVTPKDGVILDMFMGSGSTGKAAMLEGFQFIGIDLEADYVAIAERRIAWAAAQPRQEVLL